MVRTAGLFVLMKAAVKLKKTFGEISENDRGFSP